MQDNTISVCYSGNKRVFPGILLSVMSLAKYTQRPLHIYILSMDLHEQNANYLPFSENQIHILNEVLRQKNSESCAELIDVGEFFRKELAAGKNAKTIIRLTHSFGCIFPNWSRCPTNSYTLTSIQWRLRISDSCTILIFPVMNMPRRWIIWANSGFRPFTATRAYCF